MADHDHEEGKPFCPYCLAREVASAVLSSFTDMCPKVKMSYDNWMMLGALIEEEIKSGLGIPSDDSDDEDKPEQVTVQ